MNAAGYDERSRAIIYLYDNVQRPLSRHREGRSGPVNFRGVRVGIPICEDIWTEWGDYEDVVETLAESGAELMIVPNGSP